MNDIKNEELPEFPRRVKQKFEREGYTVFTICDPGSHFDFVSFIPHSRVGFVYCENDGYPDERARGRLLRFGVPVFFASENTDHKIVITRL